MHNERRRFHWNRFRTGNFNSNGKLRSVRPQEANNNELQALRKQNRAQSTRVPSAQLGMTQMAIVNHLHALGKIGKT